MTCSVTPSIATIARCEPGILDLYVERLRRDGYVILRDLVDPELIGRIDRANARLFERTPFCEGQFSGTTTKRFGGLLKRSPDTVALVAHDLVLAIADAVLGPHCDSIQLNLTQAIEIHPGAPPQIPHRDQDMYGTTLPPCELCVNVIWPTTEFTAANGATILWPASSGLHPFAIPSLDDAVTASMAPGSAIIFLGSTLHCAGQNLSDMKRRGVAVSYSLGWLKQFENQYLVYPPEIARELPRPVAELIGYRTQKPNLNNCDGRCPSALLDGPAEGHLGLIDNLPPAMADLIALHAADPSAFIANANAMMAADASHREAVH